MRALEGAVLALPRAMRTPLPEEASRGGWERWGIHGWELEAEEYARTNHAKFQPQGQAARKQAIDAYAVLRDKQLSEKK